MNTTDDPYAILPPHDLAAERATLCSAIVGGPGILDKVRAIVGTPLAFFQPDHQTIWTAVCALADAGKALDAVTLAGELRARGRFEDIGGMMRRLPLDENRRAAEELGRKIDTMNSIRGAGDVLPPELSRFSKPTARADSRTGS